MAVIGKCATDDTMSYETTGTSIVMEMTCRLVIPEVNLNVQTVQGSHGAHFIDESVHSDITAETSHGCIKWLISSDIGLHA